MDEVMQQVLDRQRFVWSQGNYGSIHDLLRPAAVALVEACGVGSGQTFLDVGAGTGNVALEAAQRGAKVIATDLTPHLIEIGKERSREAGFDIGWQEADAQNLKFEDDSFDAVGSAFGAMFAPDADAAVREMLRVVKPGCPIAMTVWAGSGYVGRMFETTSRFLPPPPEGVNTVIEWGDEETARQRFEKHAVDVEIRPGKVVWDFESAEEARRFAEEDAPPTVAAKSVLPPDTFREMMDAQEALEEEFDRGEGGRVTIDAEYLLVLGRKPA